MENLGLPLQVPLGSMANFEFSTKWEYAKARGELIPQKHIWSGLAS
jgi:hypothetical protein